MLGWPPALYVPWTAGAIGKVLLMPEDPDAVFIMPATDTGIAPYHAFWRRQFMEDVPSYMCVALQVTYAGAQVQGAPGQCH